jgi:uncharacterized protein (TIGR04255 family)
MSKLVFRHPPLVEIVAEVRWNLPGFSAIPQQTQQAGILTPMLVAQEHEALFMTFAAKIAGDGFAQCERIIPPGMPYFAYQPVYRYRKASQDQGASLYQLGTGIFAANITPPYKSWETFFPMVQRGIELLIESRKQYTQDVKFSSVTLRYINAFREPFLRGKPIYRFLSDVFGIQIGLPEALTSHCVDAEMIKPSLALSIPIKLGSMDVNFVEGWVNNVLSLIMDTAIAVNKELAGDKDAVMGVLNDAHDVIYVTFVGLTKKLHEDMSPEQTNQ